jgi:hypothetical protein
MAVCVQRLGTVIALTGAAALPPWQAPVRQVGGTPGAPSALMTPQGLHVPALDQFGTSTSVHPDPGAPPGRWAR